MKSCLYPECETPHKKLRRGLCHGHYDVAIKLIKEGKTTWKKLIEKNKATETLRGKYTKAISWFLEEDPQKAADFPLPVNKRIGEVAKRVMKKPMGTLPEGPHEIKSGRGPARKKEKELKFEKRPRGNHRDFCSYPKGFACSCNV